MAVSAEERSFGVVADLLATAIVAVLAFVDVDAGEAIRAGGAEPLSTSGFWLGTAGRRI